MHPEKRPILPATAVPDRKRARDYVKRLTANVDWEEILRHLETMRVGEANGGQDEADQEKTNGKPRRIPTPAT